ncbi:MAG: hypothetical protein EAZ55_13685 [Cytophagales bacterium]|nr:MAG: hypothetical protein EAZ55_13685 [Cytophagales bacterium]
MLLRNIILLTALFILTTTTTRAQKTPPADTCRVGVFVTDLYDFSLSDKSFNIKFWIWFNYKNDSLDLLGTAELLNAKTYEYSLQVKKPRGNEQYALQKCLANIKRDWDITHFPLDKQVLEVVVESGDLEHDKLVYVADKLHSKYDTSIRIDGWRINKFEILSEQRKYATSYGDPELDKHNVSNYSALVFRIHVERESQGLLFKLFTGVYVSFAISLLVFFMGPENAERFGLLVGALFAAIANKYIVDEMLPDSTKYTLVDKIHVISFCYILINLILTVLAYQLHTRNLERLARRLDFIAFWVVLFSYFLINYYFIYESL